MRTSLATAPPEPSDPASFPAYLRRKAHRWRVRTGSSMRYEVTVAVLFFGVGPTFGTWQGLTAPAPAHPPLTWAAGAALLIGGLALLALAAIAAGPVVVPFEYRVWLLSTPLDRGVLLRQPLRRALTLTARCGAVLSALVADGIGARNMEALAVILLGAAAGLFTGAVAVVAQPAVSRAPGQVARWTAVAMLVAAAALERPTLPHLPAAIVWSAAGVIGFGALWLVQVAGGAVRQIPLPRLTAGSGFTPAVALVAQDQSLAPLAAASIPALRRPRPVRLGHPLSGIGPAALASADRRLAFRNWAAQVRAVVLLAAAYLAAPLLHGVGWGRPALALVVFACATATISGFTDMARRLAASPGLAGRYGLDPSQSRLAAMRQPTLTAMGFAVLTAPLLLAVGLPLSVLTVTPLAWALVTYRANQRPFEPTFRLGSVYSLDQARQFLRGPGALLLAAAFVVVTAR